MAKLTTICAIIIIAAGVAAYLNAFQNGFVWDDEALVINNKYIRSCANLKEIFTTDVHRFGDKSNFYRPVQTLTYLADYSLWKLNPFGYHLTNVLIHILNGLLIYLLISRLPLPNPVNIALSTALLWIVSPVHTQCVSYVSGRADLLMTAFILLALYMHTKNNLLASLASLFFFALALISKEPAIIVTPLLILLYNSIFAGGSKRDNVFLKILPYLAIAALYILVRYTALRFPEAPDVGVNADLYSRLLTSAVAIAILVKLLILPFGLSMVRNIPWQTSLFDPAVIASIALVAAMAALGFWSIKRDKPLFFGISWFFLAYLPYINIVPLNANVSEHWMYLPSIGLFLGASYLALRRPSGRGINIGLAVVICLAAFYGYLTSVRNLDWKSEITLYNRTLENSPDSARVHYNLATSYSLKGQYDKARGHYEKAIELKPDYAEAYSNLGLIYFNSGDVDKAISLYEKANSIKDDSFTNHTNLGIAYDAKGLIDKAESEFNKALKLKPDDTTALNGLGIVHGRRGELEKAGALFKKALEINPANVDAKRNLAEVYRLMKIQK